jgi:hypothetical protein
MRNLVTTIVLVALGFVSYSQDTEISLLVQRDGGSKIKMSLLDYGTTSYFTMSSGEETEVLIAKDAKLIGSLFSCKISKEGDKLGSVYLDLKKYRFTMSLVNGASYNGDILSLETIK